MNTDLLNQLVTSSPITKKGLAKACGISRSTLDSILAGGDCKVSTLERLAGALGISAGSLFDAGERENATLDRLGRIWKDIDALVRPLFDRVPAASLNKNEHCN